ncbi:extracellular solute-binding protein [Thalassobacillus sp. C254]|uniref:extracellular solute-binding protein n=1 Tax=Thalassobacillus sp. C254 TaxID=1225341 RepID=UPI000AEAAE28|nr:extracellular solute-binding protein [Thalassobacillus sp. C254]
MQGLAAPLELSEDKVSEYQEEAIHAMTYEETLYGIPAVTETYAMYYNTEIVEEPPETLSEITALADDLTDRDNNEFGFLIEAANFYWSYPFFSGPGGYVFAQDEDGNYDTSDIGLNNEGAVEGAEQIQEWFMNGWIPTGLDDDVLDGLFTDGSVGVVVSGPWSLPGYRNALGDNLAVASLPTTDEGESLNSFAGVKGWLVSNFIESDRQYWATDLALYMTSQESSEIYFETAGELPARDDVIESDLIQEDEFFAGFAQQVQHAEAMPNVPEMSQVWDPMSDALQFISQGEDPKEVLDEAVEQIEAEIQIQGQ